MAEITDLIGDAPKIGVGAFALFTGPALTTEPAAPAEMYDDPGTPWAFSAATKEGWTFAASSDVTELTIEEQDNPVKRTKKRVLSLAATLAESGLEDFHLALGGGTLGALVAGTGSNPDKRVLTFDDSSADMAIYLIGPSPEEEGAIRTLYIPRADSSAALSVPLRRLAAYQELPVTFTSLSPGADCRMTDYTGF